MSYVVHMYIKIGKVSKGCAVTRSIYTPFLYVRYCTYSDGRTEVCSTKD